MTGAWTDDEWSAFLDGHPSIVWGVILFVIMFIGFSVYFMTTLK